MVQRDGERGCDVIGSLAELGEGGQQKAKARGKTRQRKIQRNRGDKTKEEKGEGSGEIWRRQV